MEYISDIKPFRLTEGVYFIGSSKVSVHLITTSEGLILIDTGLPDMFDQIINSIEYLGLSPKDIIAVFHSHGHIDHFGCTSRLKELSGAKTYISRIDNDIVNGTRPLSWAKELNLPVLPFFDCDVLIDDGDVFTFGEATVRCVLTPGHTQGVLSYFITVNGITCGMLGGIGLNSLTDEFLDEYCLPHSLRREFLSGLKKVEGERVDIVLGNHPHQSDTVGKLKRVENGESVTDTEEWSEIIKNTREYFYRIFPSEKKE